MSIRDKNLVLDEYYHIYNRGNDKKEIFLDEEDYDRFTKLLYVCNSKNNFVFRDSVIRNKINAFDFEKGDPLVSILGWVLMPNHFHIILVSHRSDLCKNNYNPITEFMRKVSTAYVMYFNKKYNRTGSLFEGKFKSKHIAEENYFHYIFSYVHLNPIKLIQKDWKEKGISDKNKSRIFLTNYKYSSFQDYFGKERNIGKILNKEMIPVYLIFNNIDDLFKHINL
ncbi:TPA: hypothetical protein DIC38_00110 [Candidatus Nomurabacteria bacterium]|nr:MAG: Transposase [Parcubacteria bacterium RAAC4_OD1_1]HCY26079.1 hypothetical protein [Candidatus Nomurabacteria bacterium]